MVEEVEVKLRARDLGGLRELLSRIAEPLALGVVEVDVYYNHPCRDFASTDEALRVRLAGGRAELTYKGPRAGGGVKRRLELTVGVEDGEGASGLLNHLGFREVAVVRKVRDYYRLAGATVTLDRVEGLGEFVEIEAGEGMDQAGLRALAEELGLEWAPVDETYLEMVMRRAGAQR